MSINFDLIDKILVNIRQRNFTMITLAQIQKRLAEAIEQSNMKKSQIAKELNIDPTQISSYVKGRKMPALDTLANLCKILDVDTNYILCQD